MALDALVDSTELNSGLTSVANAIRTKGNTTSSLSFPNGFVNAVNAIQTGGGESSGINTDDATLRSDNALIVPRGGTTGYTAYSAGIKYTGSLRNVSDVNNGLIDCYQHNIDITEVGSTELSIATHVDEVGAWFGPGDIIRTNVLKSQLSGFFPTSSSDGGIDTTETENPISQWSVYPGKVGFVNGQRIVGSAPLLNGCTFKPINIENSVSLDGDYILTQGRIDETYGFLNDGDIITVQTPLSSLPSLNNLALIVSEVYEDEGLLYYHGSPRTGVRGWLSPGQYVNAGFSLSNFGSATASDVAAGKTFTSASGYQIVGTGTSGSGGTVSVETLTVNPASSRTHCDLTLKGKPKWFTLSLATASLSSSGTRCLTIYFDGTNLYGNSINGSTLKNYSVTGTGENDVVASGQTYVSQNGAYGWSYNESTKLIRIATSGSGSDQGGWMHSSTEGYKFVYGY